MEVVGSLVDSEKETSTNRYYIQGSLIPIDESEAYEFKGHRDMTMDDLSSHSFYKDKDKSQMTHQPISRTLCGFLNTGCGGMIYIGVLDDGKVAGIKLTQYQKDHMVLSLRSLMSRFTPPVYKHQYKLTFVPVIKKADDVPHIADKSRYPVDKIWRLNSHVIQTPHFCWCDNDAVEQLNSGVLPPDYVVEISVKGFDKNDPHNKYLMPTEMDLHPIYQNEEKLCFVRFQGSIIKYTLEQVKEMTLQEVSSYYDEKISKLFEELQKECDDVGEDITDLLEAVENEMP